MGKAFLIILGILLLALAGSAPLSVAHDGGDGGNNGNGPPHPPEKTNGAYKITFVGYLTGAGTATVSAQHLTISGRVKDPSGQTIDLQVQCDADKNRFKGTGTAGSTALDIEGRFDPADRTGRVVRSARIVATYETSDAHHGRIAGERLADAGREPDHDPD